MTQQNHQPQMLDPETAFALVHNRVYAPVFFTKLANDFGIRPRSPQEAQAMLTQAAQLRAARDQQVKMAADEGDGMLAAAGEHLRGVLGDAGFEFEDDMDNLIKQAAVEVSGDPELAHAVLSLQAAAAAAAA